MTLPNGQTGDHGFTLIEALVVLTIAAMAIALVPATISLGKRALQVTAALEQATSNHRATTAVTDRIAAARPIYKTGADGLPALLFDGSPDRLRFVTEFADGPAGGGLYLADLNLDAASATLGLVLTPYPATAASTVASSLTVLQPAGTLSLRYFGFDAETGTRIWKSSWTGFDRLPEMIELSIRHPDTGTAAATSIIALRLARK